MRQNAEDKDSGQMSDPLPGLVAAALAEAGLPGEPGVVERLSAFLARLLEANESLSLTTIRDPREAVQRQLVEPLAGWRALAEGLPEGPVVEVGAGGGAPGIPIAIAEAARGAAGREVTLVEARERRAAYLRSVVEALGLDNVRVVEERGELFGGPAGDGRERFAVALGRALAKLPVALELLLPLVRVGGVAAIYAGPNAADSLTDATLVARVLGAETPELTHVEWPGAALQLWLATTRKSSPTPAAYPRGIRKMRRSLPRPQS